jgi:hypothetical protein
MSVHVPSRLLGYSPGMHPHLAEIVTEARFEEGPGGGIERLARRVQYIVYNRRCLGHSGTSSGRSALDQRGSDSTERPAHLGVRHPHHLLRHVIGFLFVLITWLIDPQLGLKGLPE